MVGEQVGAHDYWSQRSVVDDIGVSLQSSCGNPQPVEPLQPRGDLVPTGVGLIHHPSLALRASFGLSEEPLPAERTQGTEFLRTFGRCVAAKTAHLHGQLRDRRMELPDIPSGRHASINQLLGQHGRVSPEHRPGGACGHRGCYGSRRRRRRIRARAPGRPNGSTCGPAPRAMLRYPAWSTTSGLP